MNLITACNLSLNPASPDVISLVGGGGKSSTLLRLTQEIHQRGQRVITTTTTHMAASQMAAPDAVMMLPATSVPFAQLEAQIKRTLDTAGHAMLVTPPAEASHDPPRVGGVDSTLVDELAAHAARLGVAAILVEADGSRQRPLKAPAEYEPVIPACTTLLMPVAGLDAVGRFLDEQVVQRLSQVHQVLGLAKGLPPPRITPEMVARLLVDTQGGAKGLPSGARLLPLLNKADGPFGLITGRLIARQLVQQARSALIGATGCGDAQPIEERWAPVAGVVLAAGQSKRMGSAKQLVEVDGIPMVVRAVRVMRQSGVSQVVVVTGSYADAVQEILAPLQECHGARLRFVHNNLWQSGQASSVRSALQALPSVTQAALFLPTDQPHMQPTLLRRMIQQWRQGAQLVATHLEGQTERQIRGAPGLFDHTLWPELCALQGDVGARPLIQKHRADLVTVAADPLWLRDYDTPADLLR